VIPFNKPYLSGRELEYINNAISQGKISGNGDYTKKCQSFFNDKYGFSNCLLTTSATDALEMAAILCNIQKGDEVIVPSYTFVSTANSFILRGANIVFADSKRDNPGIDERSIESLITSRTKVIVPVHYAGISCEMDIIMDIANKHDLLVVEDASHAIDSYFSGKPLGGIGHLGCYSFHETKNIQSGEGGMLIINDERFKRRAEIIWEKGTNRSEFFRGEVSKYGWVDIGSSFLPSEIMAAFLWAQIESLEKIQNKRKYLWSLYFEGLKPLAEIGYFSLPDVPFYATNNAHLFYLICRSLKERTLLINHLKRNKIQAVFHYISLHSSEYYKRKHDGRSLFYSDLYTDCLLRLPLFFELEEFQVSEIIDQIRQFYLK
jgi:dTDP-4-amino-4,6-dideoxygalactose transaminase